MTKAMMDGLATKGYYEHCRGRYDLVMSEPETIRLQPVGAASCRDGVPIE